MYLYFMHKYICILSFHLFIFFNSFLLLRHEFLYGIVMEVMSIIKFYNQQEVAEKWRKLKHSRKPYICSIRTLSVNREVKNPRAV